MLAFNKKKVWLAINVSVGIMVITAWIFHRITNRSQDQSQNSIIFWSFFVVRIWTSQGRPKYMNVCGYDVLRYLQPLALCLSRYCAEKPINIFTVSPHCFHLCDFCNLQLLYRVFYFRAINTKFQKSY